MKLKPRSKRASTLVADKSKRMNIELIREPNVKLRPTKWRNATRKELRAIAHSLRLRDIHVDWLVAAQRRPTLIFVYRLKKLLRNILVDSWYQPLIWSIKRICPAKDNSINATQINSIQDGKLKPILEVHGANAAVGSHGWQNVSDQATASARRC